MSEISSPDMAHRQVSRPAALSEADKRFLRFCRARLAGTAGRIAFILAAAGVFALIGGSGGTAWLALLVVAGELAETLVLRRILADTAVRRAVPNRAHRMAMMAGLAQAGTLVLSVGLMHWASTDDRPYFLIVTLLIGAAMEAGASLPIYRPAMAPRIALYAVSLAVLQGLEFARHGIGDFVGERHPFDLVASTLVVVMAAAFIRFNLASYARRVEFAQTLREERRQLLESRRVLAEREREGRRLAMVARHANDGVIIYRADGTVDWVNETFERVLGYSAEELIGRHIEKVIDTSDLETAGAIELVRARQAWKPCRTELQSRTRDGRILWLDVMLTPLPGGGGLPPLMIAVEREITEAKAREEELARARAEAEAGAQAKARFLATMSHEIRTPMNGVIGTAELLAETGLSTEQKLYVDTIVESGRALLTIINDILELSRLRAGATVLAREPLDLSDCLSKVALLLGPTASAKGLKLDFSGPEGGMPPVMADGGRLRQIAINLLGNAIKFTASGGVSLRLEAQVVERSCKVRIAVIDTGVGIPPDRIEAIFESFTQAETDTTQRFGGTGLGLTISRLLAREMGGEIHVRSTVGEGSEFVLELSLPLAETVASEAPAPELDCRSCDSCSRADEPCSVRDGGPLTILLAEDNRTNALIVERMLGRDRHRVRWARDGAEAIALYEEVGPDVVLMDLSMPGMSGFDALAHLRAIDGPRGRRVPVIAFTANGLEEDRLACLEAGFEGFVTKPVTREALVGEIRRCLLRNEGAVSPELERLARAI